MNANKRNRFIAVCVAAAVGLTLSGAASAQDKSTPLGGLEGGPTHRPWAEGISLKRQQDARQIFYKANELLVNQFFRQAAEKYREVLAVWDHPAVYYNLSLALMNLEQPVELYEALGQALRHGMPPLVNQANYDRAKKYHGLLEQQLAHIDIVCEEEGARVTLDGKLLFVSPGRYRRAILAGEHTIAATRAGFIADTRPIVLTPGKRQRFELTLYTLADLTQEKRRFPVWMPWLVTGGGVALTSLGGVLHSRSRTGFQTYDSDFGTRCTGGCADGDVPELSDQLDSAVWQQRAAYGMYMVGGLAMTGGLVLVFLNRPETIRREIPGVARPPGLTVVPVVGPGMTGINARVRF
ncbi:MAG: hypothetical protein MJE77_43400 [Proteobacteria bacterium]|nr:hypothetical protein [Pseudomonadota bacterium]